MSPKAVSDAYMHIPFRDSVFVQQRIQQMSGCLDSELIAAAQMSPNAVT
jgi:hypothetical protein